MPGTCAGLGKSPLMKRNASCNQHLIDRSKNFHQLCHIYCAIDIVSVLTSTIVLYLKMKALTIKKKTKKMC